MEEFSVRAGITIRSEEDIHDGEETGERRQERGERNRRIMELPHFVCHDSTFQCTYSQDRKHVVYKYHRQNARLWSVNYKLTVRNV